MPSPSSFEAITSSLPPKTDYITYLTILESHLTKDLLPTLFEILQDTELTANIGWDLIGLLTPLLPASKPCLQEIARLGNPRELILKVTEVLRDIDFEDEQDDVTDDESLPGDGRINAGGEYARIHGEAVPERSPPDDAEERAVNKCGGNMRSDIEGESLGTNGNGSSNTPYMPVLKFTTLLNMLCIIHPRIKTKYPSCFLSSTLQAVLATYRDAIHSLTPCQVNEVTRSVVHLIKSLSGEKRPFLPPRRYTSQVQEALKAAPDPEAHEEATSKDESAIERRLLQSFVTYVLEDYILSLGSDDNVLGLAWAARLWEKLHPEKVMPGRPTFGQLFINRPQLQARESAVGELVAIARDLNIDSEELFQLITQPTVNSNEFAEYEGPPGSATDISLSLPGSLFLLVSRLSSYLLFGSSLPLPSFQIFPDHDRVLRTFISSSEVNGLGGFGGGQDAIIDAVLALGLWALEESRLGAINEIGEDDFNKYLQTLSFVSAQNPSPTLRYQAHILCSSILHSHPSESVRLTFIRDTLEYCPFEALKGSAVGWLKDETLVANRQAGHEHGNVSIFKQPAILTTLSSYLFPDIRGRFEKRALEDAWDAFQANFPFYLTSLNFYYLLLSAPDLRECLELKKFHFDCQVQESFLDPLGQAANIFKEGLATGPLATEADDLGVPAGITELEILDDALARVVTAINALNDRGI